MKRILLALLLLAPAAIAQTFQVQPAPVSINVVCPQGQATSAGDTFTCPGSVIPQCPSPPGPGPCNVPPAGSVFVGDLQFNGAQLDTNGVGPNTTCTYGRITIPAGAQGMTSSVVALVNGSGANSWKQATLTKTPCDFSNQSAPVFAQGQNVTLFMAFTTPRQNAVTVLPGQVFYFSVRQQLPFSPNKSCALPSCDFGIRLYPPS